MLYLLTIPGSLSNPVFRSLIDGQLQLVRNIKITRLDVDLTLNQQDDFTFSDSENNLLLTETVHLQQKYHQMVFLNTAQPFYNGNLKIFYFGDRKKKRMLRVYFYNDKKTKRWKLRFQVEFKQQSAQLFHETIKKVRIILNSIKCLF